MVCINVRKAITGDGKTVLSPAWILVKDGKILSIGTKKPAFDGRVIELNGVTVIPGLMNIHDHICRKTLRIPDESISFGSRTAQFMSQSHEALILYSAHNMRQYLLEEGITWVRDYGLAGTTSITLDRAIRSGIAIGPELECCAVPICTTGGHCYKQSHEADGVPEVLKAVRRQAEQGAKIIKFMCSGGLEHFPREIPSNPEFTLEELTMGVNAAKDLGLQTAIHAYSHEAVRRGILAGVNSIEHGALISDDQVLLMAEKNISFVPTMSGIRAAFSSGPNQQYWDRLTDEIFSKQERAIRAAQEAGVLIGAGTDSLGYLFDEIRLIGRTLGKNPTEAIAHATSINAKIAGRDDLGELAVGKRANIVGFVGDLEESLDFLDGGASFVMKDGIVYKD